METNVGVPQEDGWMRRRKSCSFFFFLLALRRRESRERDQMWSVLASPIPWWRHIPFNSSESRRLKPRRTWVGKRVGTSKREEKGGTRAPGTQKALPSSMA